MENLNKKENLEDNSDETLRTMNINNPLEETDAIPNFENAQIVGTINCVGMSVKL